MHRRRMRGGRNIFQSDSTIKMNPTSSILKNLLNAAFAFIVKDLASPKSNIKKLINRFYPKITYDDTKEIKVAKYKVIKENQKT